MMNTGKGSERFFEENVSGLVFRLRDKADLVGLNGGKNVASFGNPSDFLVANKAGVFFVEVKSTTNKTSFSLSCFTPAQKAAIYKLHKRGLGSLYRIYIHNLDINQWYLMTADSYMSHLSTGKKSVKWKDLTTLTSW
jgi:penicillin-binding protein-related factor A (putative recombinase)